MSNSKLLANKLLKNKVVESLICNYTSAASSYTQLNIGYLFNLFII